MNKPNDQRRPINMRRFLWPCIVLLLVSYIYGQPHLEKMLGIQLPSLGDDQTNVTRSNSDDLQPKPKTSSNNQQNENAQTGKPWDQPSGNLSAAKKFKLTDIGRNRLESPAGLIYGMGPRNEHRVDHVMRHATDNPLRPVHSVFVGKRDQILETIDDAYRLIKNKSQRVTSEKDGSIPNRVAHIVKMERKVGYEGGRKGQDRGHPDLKRLKLILERDKHVITAYPYR